MNEGNNNGKNIKIFWNFVQKTKITLKLMWPLKTSDKISALAAAISVVAAAATVWSSYFSKDQALSARLSAKAAVDALQRSDENLVILTDVDRDAPITLSGTGNGNVFSFSIGFSAHAVIVNTGGSPAVVMDSVVETDAAARRFESRVGIFNESDGAAWSKLAVIQPNDPLRLSLRGCLGSNNLLYPSLAKALFELLRQTEFQNARLERQFSSFTALGEELHKRYGKNVAGEFDSFLYGPASKSGSLSASPWSEKGEVGFSRIILKVSTASHRVYRSSPGLLVFGSDSSYDIK